MESIFQVTPDSVKLRASRQRVTDEMTWKSLTLLTLTWPLPTQVSEMFSFFFFLVVVVDLSNIMPYAESFFMCLDLRSCNHFAKSFCFALQLSSKLEVSAIRTPRTETCISGASARSQYPGQGLVVQRGSRLQYISKGPGSPVSETRPVWAKGFGLFTSRLQRRIERYVT